MLNLHRANPKLHLINAAVVPLITKSLIILHVTDDAVSTTDEDFRKIWSRYDGINYRPIYISPVSVPDVVDLYHTLLGENQPDFINVDTEGTTLELTAMLSPLLNPRVWCVEYAVGNHSYELDFKHLFQGYHVTYRSGENLVFVRDQHPEQ